MICPRCGKPMRDLRCVCGYEMRLRRPTGSPRNDQSSESVDFNSKTIKSEPAAARMDHPVERLRPEAVQIPGLNDLDHRIDELFSSPAVGSAKDTPSGTSQLDLDTEAQDTMELPGIPLRVSAKAAPPQQKRLALEPLSAKRLQKPPATARKDPARGISREILFSRVLAGILDLLAPMAIAMLFVFAACRFLQFDFFSPSSTRAWIGLALVFYFLNSLYFLTVAGRTPGMCLTELRLASDNEEDAGFARILVRVVVFLPVLVTVVGLLWAVFDSRCRTLHDRLSKTLVLPAGESQHPV